MANAHLNIFFPKKKIKTKNKQKTTKNPQKTRKRPPGGSVLPVSMKIMH